MLFERTSKPLGSVLRSSSVVRLQDWRDARFAGRPWRAAGVILVPIAVLAALAVAVDNSVLLLPSAWLLLLVAAGALLGGWRVGMITAVIATTALALIVSERDADLGLPGSRTVWAVVQFLIAATGVAVAVGATDRAIREMRRATTALTKSEQRAVKVAGSLQRSILPEDPPDIPGLRIVARYLPADASEIGGDFYDWYRAADDSWYLQIGDVCGKGPAAASRALLARYTLRTSAMLDGDPARMLRSLNTAILAEGDDRYCTAAILRFQVNRRPDIHVDAVLGGHPHALVLNGDEVHPFGKVGSLLGLFEDVDLACDHRHLQPGDRLFLYTDGITDYPSQPLDEANLHALLRRLNLLPLEDFASRLEEQLLGRPGNRDDIAFIVIAVDGAG
ncbi:MAG TPA: PP2C family protein-serine/threonine phosphatase [Euzebyales bacterium]|nr:PP2C family protein-serine/threonine phosphatase [Euzebyales bacterium]